MIDRENDPVQLATEYEPPTFKGYMQAFGTIMFAFGGASTFPTIQVRAQDMKDLHISSFIPLLNKRLTWETRAISNGQHLLP